jgi:hypothetical protein
VIGPRNSVIAILQGKQVTPEEYLSDKSEFIDTRYMSNDDFPELWITQSLASPYAVLAAPLAERQRAL